MGFFNLHKPLQYKYRYIYYDPKKEAQKERDEKIKGLDQQGSKQDVKEYKPTIQRGTFREIANQRGDRRAAEKQSNIRLIVIIIALLLVMYLLMK